MPTSMELTRAIKKYFPHVTFTAGNNERISAELLEILGKYIVCKANGCFLDIYKMMGNSLFAPLFPGRDFRDKYQAELQTKLNSNEYPDIVLFYMEKYEQKFTRELARSKMKNEIVFERTLKEEFFYDKKIKCQYSLELNDDDKIEEKFDWDLVKIGLAHRSVRDVYKAFCYYAHKDCSLRLFGADFVNFREDREAWPVVPGGGGETLPEKLGNYVNELSAENFIWKNGAKWSRTENIKHLLEKCGLNDEFRISLKDFYYSFCVSLLGKNDYSGLPGKDAFTKIGNDIINNTLLKDAHKKKWNVDGFWYDSTMNQTKKENEAQKKSDAVKAWYEILSYILEGKTESDRYRPWPFEAFIEKAAGQADFLAEWHNAERAAEHDGTLNQSELQTVKQYIKEMIPLVPEKRREELYDLDKNGSEYEKIKKLKELLSMESIKDAFSGRSKTIDAMYRKISSRISIDDQLDNQFDDGGKGLRVKDTIEDKNIQIEQDILNEEAKRLLLLCFESEFADEKEWIRFIQKETPSSLFAALNSYPPPEAGRLKKGTETQIWKEYCRISGISAAGKGAEHTRFAKKMRNVTDKFQKENWR